MADSDDEEIVQGAVDEPEEEEAPEDTTLANCDVVTKYQEAARIVNFAMNEIAGMCVPGASILSICIAADALLEQRAGAIFRGKGKNGKPIERGVAFPVCISVNEIVCHYSPLASEDKLPALVAGDMVKMDLGVHIDGYIAVGAHTVVVGFTPSAEAPETGRRADVLAAAWAAAEVAARMIKPGNTNTQVTAAVKKIADAYDVRPISGTVMHEMKRFVIDGKKNVLLRADNEEKVEACTFEQNEVYSIDVAMSTGEGKPRPTDFRTTVFKRNVERKFGLKVKASRMFFNDVNKRFPTMPFCSRSFEETAAKMGVRECVTHELLAAYPVLIERPGDFVAHVKFTVLLLPGGTTKVTGLEIPSGFATPDRALPEDILEILNAEDEKAKKKAKKKSAAKKKAAAAAGGASEA